MSGSKEAKKSGTGTRARKAGPARQSNPTADRYREIQQALADRGYYPSTPSGEWNAESTEALKRFQADNSLKADGRLGALSLIALGLGPNRESESSDGVAAKTSEPDKTP